MDPIEEDDEKMDELLMLQSMYDETQPVEYDSIEEKYESKIIMDHIDKLMFANKMRGKRGV